jgi:hypothetical protein
MSSMSLGKVFLVGHGRVGLKSRDSHKSTLPVKKFKFSHIQKKMTRNVYLIGNREDIDSSGFPLKGKLIDKDKGKGEKNTQLQLFVESHSLKSLWERNIQGGRERFLKGLINEIITSRSEDSPAFVRRSRYLCDLSIPWHFINRLNSTFCSA